MAALTAILYEFRQEPRGVNTDWWSQPRRLCQWWLVTMPPPPTSTSATLFSTMLAAKFCMWLRDRPRALKKTAPNLSIIHQTSND
eukprot:12046825-Heterocapsa_arctica.AAC.1